MKRYWFVAFVLSEHDILTDKISDDFYFLKADGASSSEGICEIGFSDKALTPIKPFLRGLLALWKSNYKFCGFLIGDEKNDFITIYWNDKIYLKRKYNAS